ncbi:uncharacterized protein STEHIDRAFT_165852 [Stereum hirsutum FP-91666 SS1]|uniref:uncharacterized protein n=1 Tax=Stereum hirsutum (strain FP-91666) TaxID=721885 RepID=UPI0004410675|nr:uncharacterized protein STEHIDRAFT_165852 [Stereum hirsutum FP-91666 SS1]EIM91596.1 hypothetical protein STEHIDRAFT_165852 [Stereum hirsutum FP-91666 SS1]
MLDIYIGGALLAMFFFGVFTILIIFSTYTVLSSGHYTRTNILMIAAPLTMYAVSAAHLGMGLGALDPYADNLESSPSVWARAWMYLPIVNYIVSDAVVVWRCWVLYSRKCRIIMIPLLLTVSNVVVAISIAGLDVKILSLSSTVPAPGVSGPYTGNIVVWSLSLATNMLTTAMVAFKSWRHRKTLRKMLGRGSPKTRAEKVMALLVESGAMYCVIWVAFLIPALITGFNGTFVMSAVMPQISGIYPTILIVLVKFGKTNFENDFAYTEEPQVITTRARARNSANMNTENRKSGPYMLSRPVSFPPPSPLGSGWTVVTESKYEGERRASLPGVEKVEEV